MDSPLRPSPLWYRIMIGLAGSALVVAGTIMLVTPGPGWLTIAAGVAVWATEFEWARHLLQELRQRVKQLRERPGRAPKE